MTESKQICGADLLRNPQLNRADAFTQEERDARGLRGLLPPAVSTMELQVKRTLALLDRCPTALDKFLMLDSLHATDEDLYFKILIDYIDDYMPGLHPDRRRGLPEVQPYLPLSARRLHLDQRQGPRPRNH